MLRTYTYSFEAIGTSWSIDFAIDGSPQQANIIDRAIRSRIEIFDQTYSRFRTDSLVHHIASKPGTYPLPSDAHPLLACYRKLYEATNGQVTPLIGNLLVAAGYDRTYSLKPQKQFNPVPLWDDVLQIRDDSITTTEPIMLDFGAAGKGYCIDIVADLLRNYGCETFVIDAGGDILRSGAGNDTLRIGLEHPEHPEQAIGVIDLKTGSLCGSATNRRAWQDLHHIMNPSTRKPVRDIVASWVVADTAMLADGIATALFFTPPETLRQSFDFEYCIVGTDLSSQASPMFERSLFHEVAA